MNKNSSKKRVWGVDNFSLLNCWGSQFLGGEAMYIFFCTLGPVIDDSFLLMILLL